MGVCRVWLTSELTGRRDPFLLCPKEHERDVHVNQRPAFRLLVTTICKLPAEKPRVCGKAIM